MIHLHNRSRSCARAVFEFARRSPAGEMNFNVINELPHLPLLTPPSFTLILACQAFLLTLDMASSGERCVIPFKLWYVLAAFLSIMAIPHRCPGMASPLSFSRYSHRLAKRFFVRPSWLTAGAIGVFADLDWSKDQRSEGYAVQCACQRECVHRLATHQSLEVLRR